MSGIHSDEEKKSYDKFWLKMIYANTTLHALHQPGNKPKEAKSTWIAVDALWLVSFVTVQKQKLIQSMDLIKKVLKRPNYLNFKTILKLNHMADWLCNVFQHHG